MDADHIIVAPAHPDTPDHHVIDTFMVFDVESIGLHGEGFAVGWVVVTREGQRLAEGVMACDPARCIGTDENHQWAADNVPRLVYAFNHPRALRTAFWAEWRRWSDRGAQLVADCAWPVEARFLAACVDDDETREWQGPYPLHDLASVLLSCGRNPLETVARRDDELPAHHPLNDARQSARVLVECLTRLADEREINRRRASAK